jgi:hypothetical protein
MGVEVALAFGEQHALQRHRTLRPRLAGGGCCRFGVLLTVSATRGVAAGALRRLRLSAVNIASARPFAYIAWVRIAATPPAATRPLSTAARTIVPHSVSRSTFTRCLPAATPESAAE